MSEFTPINPQKSDNTPLIAFAVAGALFLICICIGIVVFGAMGGLVWLRGASTGPFPTSVPGFPFPDDSEPIPTVNAEPPPEDAEEVLAALEAAVLPPRDRYDLAARLKGITNATVEPRGEYAVGDREEFWVDNDEAGGSLRVQAEMVYKNDVVYMWIEVGYDYNLDDVQRSADNFANNIYETNHEYFGMEPNPGIDGDPHLHILNTPSLESGVAGYFYSPSEYPEEAVPFSNEKEIFFIQPDAVPIGTDIYESVLAHEFQHMIHWNVDRNEESWTNEGLSEVAAFLNGYGPSDHMISYLFEPDIQLTGWPEGGGSSGNYGGGFLFNLYFLDRFGHDALKELVKQEQNGMRGVDATLADLGEDVSANEVFADFSIANYLNDQTIDPEYGYISLENIQPPGIADTVFSYPYNQPGTQVHQYGVDYIELDEAGNVHFAFDGSRQVLILPTTTVDTDTDPATDDSFVWWSNRGDDSDTILTRTVDLTGIQSATLEYDVWYWIEEDYDYGYVEVSTDGERWTILETEHMTTTDPHGNAYGSSYTGQSSNQFDANSDGWLHESVDLSDYAGREIFLRFEFITDDAVNQPGMAVDNICISEIDWCDNAEEEDADWETQGWVRHNNILAQTFSVRVIFTDANGDIQVETVELDEANHGEMDIHIESGDTAVIVISGLTRHTTVSATYSYDLSSIQ
jgi:immune inhibitor A